MQETIRSYSVSKYLTAVKNLIDTRVKDTWVHGVITQIQERDKMVYLSIAEFIEGDVKPQATLPLYLFRFDFNKIKLKLSALSKPFALIFSREAGIVRGKVETTRARRRS